MDNFRTTGRTFRMILEAVKQCSHGKKVIITVHNRNYIKDIHEHLLIVIGGYINSEGYYVRRNQGIVGIVGAGHIRVMTNHALDNTLADNPKWLNEHVIMRDHYQPDLQSQVNCNCSNSYKYKDECVICGEHWSIKADAKI